MCREYERELEQELEEWKQAARAEADYADDFRRRAVVAERLNEEHRAIIHKRNVHIREQRRENIKLKGDLTRARQENERLRVVWQ